MSLSNEPLPPPAADPQLAGTAEVKPVVDETLLEQLSPWDTEALRWSVRASEGLSAEAQAQLAAWLAADPAHREAYESLEGVWASVDGIAPAGIAKLRTSVALHTASASSARETAGKLVDTRPVEAPPPPAPLKRGRRRFFASQALVGALLAGVLGSGGWIGWQHWQSQPVFSRGYATERGQSLAIALPDGSGLLLDTATRADVTLFRNRREVRLPEGQVVFEVQGDQARPFDVLAGTARVTVVGTKFAVSYTPSLGDQAVRVAVIEGRVRVSTAMGMGSVPAPEGSASVVELAPGQAVVVSAKDGLGVVQPIAAATIAPWRERRLNFEGVPLADVLAAIGRYADIGAHFADPAVGRLPVTASVNLQNLGVFVRSLPQVLPVQVLPRDDGGWDIVGAPARPAAGRS